jgi:hypothetical protein
MPAINIASYTVSTGLQRPGGTTQHERVIELRSEALYHGITWRILLAFHTNFGSWSGSPVAGYMNLFDPAHPVIAAWLGLGEFPIYYDLVRGEQPLVFTYERSDPGATGSGYLSRIALGTARQEPPGEGDHDTSGAVSILFSPELAAALAQAGG